MKLGRQLEEKGKDFGENLMDLYMYTFMHSILIGVVEWLFRQQPQSDDYALVGGAQGIMVVVYVWS